MWRACLPYSYMQEKYIQMYKDTEKEEFDEKMKVRKLFSVCFIFIK